MRQFNRKTLSYVMSVGVVLVCLTGGFLIWSTKHQPQAATPDIPLVRTSTTNQTSAIPTYTYSGEVRARYESQLAFQVSGKILKRNVELGSTVNAGDVLLQIDPKDLQQTVNSSSAQVYSAEAQLKLAESNLKRYRQLFTQNAISRAQLDQYQNAYEVALASVQQASAQYAQGANQLDYSLLCADQPGVVSSITAEAGQIVAAGQTVVTLVQNGEREIEINVPENRIDTLRKVSQVKVAFWALPNVVVDGKIREIAPVASSISRTYKVRISLLNPPSEIKLGMTAAVEVADSIQQSNSVVYIPLTAIYQTNDTPSVWVVKDGVVKLRSVKVGSFQEAQVQVLAGLNPGETIVTAGVQKLREGQMVRLIGGGNQ